MGTKTIEELEARGTVVGSDIVVLSVGGVAKQSTITDILGASSINSFISITVTENSTLANATLSGTLDVIGAASFGTAEVSGNATVLSILGAADNTVEIAFGDNSDANIGRILYNNVSNQMVFTVNTAEMFVLQGDGTLKLNSSASWTANGSETVTISNLAPAGVGTATIGKWLTLTDNNGIVYYLPAWT